MVKCFLRKLNYLCLHNSEATTKETQSVNMTSSVHEPMEVNSDDLKKRLFHSFREQGHLDSLKSQLRKRLVTELSHTRLIEKFPGPVSKLSDKESLTLRACNSLVADHLRTCCYDYSLSVFLPESGIAEDKLFTVRDIMQLLRIHPQSNLFKEVTTSSGPGFLWQFLSDLSLEHHSGTEEKSCQTEGCPVKLTFLGDKLDSVEKAYNAKTEDPKWTESIEDRLLVHERTIASKAKSSLNNEIARFKASEIEKVRLQERENLRKEMNILRKQLESQYQIKIEALAEKERQTSEGLEKEREITKKETFLQRQKLLEELDSLRIREAEVRRERDLYAKTAKEEEERQRTIGETLRKREAAVARVEQTLEIKLQEQMTSYDIEQKSKYMSRMQNLEVREVRNREETRLLQEDKARVAQMKKEIHNKTVKAAEVEQELDDLKKTMLSMTKENEIMTEKLQEMTDYRDIKEEVAVLRRELENTKLVLEEVKYEQKIERAKYEDQIKGLQDRLTKPTPEMVALQLELARTKDQMKDEESLLKQKEVHLRTKLHQELDKNRDLQRQTDEQTREIKLLSDECSNLRTTLSDTQKALSNEVYRNPAQSVTVKMLQTVSEDESSSEMDLLYNETPTMMNINPSIQTDPFKFDNSAIPQRSTSPNLALDKFLADTRSRFTNLEKEAESLDYNFSNYHERLTNIDTSPKDKPPLLKQTSWSNFINAPPSSTSFKPLHPPTIDLMKSPTVEPMKSPTVEPIKSPTVERMKSPTVDLTADVQDSTRDDGVLSPVIGSSKVKSVNIKPSISIISPRRPPPKSTNKYGVSPKKETQDPLLVGDTWKSASLSESDQPTQDSYTDDNFSEEVSQSKDDYNFEQDMQPSPDTNFEPKPAKEESIPISLDSAWKPEVGTEKIAPVSLDSAWKQDTVTAAVDQEPETQKMSEEQDEEEEERWKEERKRREAERRRLEQEAWEKEQRELQGLLDQQYEEVKGLKADSSESKAESDKQEVATTVEEEKPKDEEDAKIDPVMQKYMQMVQQKKEEEKKQDTTKSEEHHISIEEELASFEGASDDNFDDW
ncbi:centriole and centriolar satellite protein OFD1-like [Glandiceps talaboti]